MRLPRQWGVQRNRRLRTEHEGLGKKTNQQRRQRRAASEGGGAPAAEWSLKAREGHPPKRGNDWGP